MAFITAIELNYIIYRYLQESAFNFGYEAGLNNSPIDGNLVPRAALVALVQLGLQYKEMQANVENDVDEDFCVLQPMDLITKGVNELKQIVKDRKDNPNVAAGGQKNFVKEKKGNRNVAAGGQKNFNKGIEIVMEKKGNRNVAAGGQKNFNKGIEIVKEKKGNRNVAAGGQKNFNKGIEIVKEMKGNRNVAAGGQVNCNKGNEGGSSRVATDKGFRGNEGASRVATDKQMEGNDQVKKRTRRLRKKYA